VEIAVSAIVMLIAIVEVVILTQRMLVVIGLIRMATGEAIELAMDQECY